MKQIAIIGVGQLGSRHLQALAKCDFNVDLHIVDPNRNSLDIAEKRFLELPKNKKINSTVYSRSINELPNHLDFVIIATNADVRFQVIKNLFKNRKTDNLLLEKVLFQSIKEYELANSLFEKKGVKVWVNCVRRSYSIYREVKKYFPPSKAMQFSANGNQWGIGSNAIHMIDLFALYTETTDYKLDFQYLDKQIFQNKRQGFIEFSGTLTGVFSDSHSISLTSKLDNPVSLEISIRNNRFRLDINEIEKSAILTDQKINKITKLKFTPIYQSSLSQIIATEILEKGDCCLTPYKEAMNLHLPLIKELIKFQQNLENKKIHKLLIT
jgi:hypothetical protein